MISTVAPPPRADHLLIDLVCGRLNVRFTELQNREERTRPVRNARIIAAGVLVDVLEMSPKEAGEHLRLTWGCWIWRRRKWLAMPLDERADWHARACVALRESDPWRDSEPSDAMFGPVSFPALRAYVFNRLGQPIRPSCGHVRQGEMWARTTTVGIAREITSMSYPEIARAMHGRGHTTSFNHAERWLSRPKGYRDAWINDTRAFLTEWKAAAS